MPYYIIYTKFCDENNDDLSYYQKDFPILFLENGETPTSTLTELQNSKNLYVKKL